MKKRKKIVLVGNTAWSMYNFRANLIRRLLSCNYHVIVIAPQDELYSAKLKSIQADFIPVSMASKSANPLRDILYFIRLFCVYKRVKPDFVFHYTIKPNIYGSIAAHILKRPSVAVVTGLGYTFINDNLISKISKKLYKYTLHCAEAVWFLNNEDKNEFIKRKLVYENRAKVLNGEGIDLKTFVPVTTSCPKENNISFLLSARMLWDKGIGEFVLAAKILKVKYSNLQFNLLGAIGVDNPSAIQKSQIEEWVKAGIVNYWGETDNVIPYLEEATVIVLPSYREGMSRALLEAAAMEKPIITTDTIGCRNIVDNEVSGFLCKVKDHLSLLDAMDKIIHLSPEKRNEMGRAGRLKMLREFDEELVIDEYINVLNKYL